MIKASPLLAVAAFAAVTVLTACGQTPADLANPTVRGSNSSIQTDQAATRDAQIR